MSGNEITNIFKSYKYIKAEFSALEEFIYSCIKTIQSGKLRALLFEKYINCKTWEEVSEAIGNRSEYWVRHTLHAKAIRAALAADIPPT